jgi:hypothetical protein
MTRAVAAAGLVVILALSGCGIEILTGPESSQTPRPRPDPVDDPVPESPKSPESPESSESPGPEVPYLPALGPIEDPGTVDRLLGTFPVDDSRNYQHAWVEYSGKGRRMAQVARNLEADAQIPILTFATDSDVYYSGAVVCTELLSNYPPSQTYAWLTEYWEAAVPAGAGEGQTTFVSSVVIAAVDVLCPEAKPVLDDPEYMIDTPVMLRTVLGVDKSQLSNDQANEFANWVCNELDRGATEGRLSVTVAEEYDFPDDRAEALVSQVKLALCG